MSRLSDSKIVPVSVGEKAELRITRLNSDGDGVGSVQGFTVFVPGALPGERISTVIRKIHRNYAEASLNSILDASDSRIDVACPNFGICGGCQLMHLDYREQLTYKRQKVVDALERIGKFRVASIIDGQDDGDHAAQGDHDVRGSFAHQDRSVMVHLTLPSPSTTRYRNKVQVLASNAFGGVIGMCKTGSNDVVQVTDCSLAPERAVGIINRLKDLLFGAGIPFKEWPKVARDKNGLRDDRHGDKDRDRDKPITGRGVGYPVAPSGFHGVSNPLAEKPSIRHILVRTSSSSHKVMVIIVTDPGTLDLDGIIGKLTGEFPEVESVIRNINAHPTSDVPLGNRNIVLYGSPYIVEELDEIKFIIAPNAFFQVNTEQTVRLYQRVLEFADPQPDDVVLDLYCGVGSISLFLARKAAKVVGIEVVREAVQNAVGNAELNGMDNLEFHAGQVEQVLPGLLAQGIRPDIVVLDPPRKGCEKSALDALAAVEPKRIVYVSCDPASLARDLRVLASFGYRVEEAQPVDMFPMTSHVESVVLMTNRSLKDK